MGEQNSVSEEVIAQVYCAAIIHDMARTHDGYCEMHGQWAVERKLPIWKEQFLGWGLTEEQLELVAFAVYWYCKDRRDFHTSLDIRPLVGLFNQKMFRESLSQYDHLGQVAHYLD